MNEGIRLKSVRISGFRRLNQPIEIEFAEGPGITILVGPNGSGKSTVLDGIEWALTGGAGRLPKLTGSQARRAPDIFKSLGSTEEPDVSLRFVGVDDGADHIIASRNGLEGVPELLRRTAAPWRDIRSIEAALKWTHFSSQRSTSRLGYEDGDAILKAFAAPAGLEKLKGLDRRLWGAETRSAMKELQREAASRLHKHEVAMQHAVRLATAPLDDGDSLLARRLAELKLSLKHDLALSVEHDGTDLEAIEGLLLADRTKLENQLAEVRQLSSELRDAQLRVRRLNVEEDAARQSLDTSIQFAARRKEASELARFEMENRQAGLGRLAESRKALQEALIVSALKDELDERIVRAREGLQDSEVQVRSLSDALVRFAQLEAVTIRVRAGTALRELGRTGTDVSDFGDPEAVCAEARKLISELSPQRERLVQQRNQAQTTLSEETERFQSLAALASVLATNLHKEDTQCPVCHADYAAGELIERARRVLVTQGPAARQIAQSLNELTQEVGRVSGQLQLATSRLEDAEALLTSRRRLEAERERHRQLFGETWSAEAQDVAEARMFELLEELSLDDDVDVASVRLGLEERRRRLDPVIQDLSTELASSEERRHQLLSLTVRDAGQGELRAEIRAIDAQYERASSGSGEAQNEYRHALELAEHADRSASRAQEMYADLASSLYDERLRAAEIQDRLAALASGMEDGEFIQAMQDRSVNIGSALERLGSLRSELATTTQAPRNSDELALLRATYLPTNPRATPEELRRQILAELSRSQAELEALTELGEQLSQRARLRRELDNRLHGSALRPWNSLFRSVYASLAGSLGETLEWTADRVDMRQSEIESHATPRVSGQPIHGWLAGHFFSEGQLAALQISAMITASVLLPWSRWRALLLDDPLQHADVIKVGAFADLIRSLCQDEKHQIILTTHDQIQAEFIAAKFQAAGLGAKVQKFDRPAAQFLGSFDTAP